VKPRHAMALTGKERNMNKIRISKKAFFISGSFHRTKPLISCPAIMPLGQTHMMDGYAHPERRE
jgi:hypothetical protein